MNNALRTSASGMIAQQKRVDVIANNLANVNTTGFKRSRAAFEDVLYDTVQGARVGSGAEALEPMQIGRGVRLAAVSRIHTGGGVEMTARPLDLAIEGEGFFQVAMPDGTMAYTRDGSFTLSEGGRLVTAAGHPVMPDVIIPTDATGITISEGGQITVNGGTAGEAVEVGRIELVRFANPAGLLALGGNLYGETAASGQAAIGTPNEDGFGRVLQGSLETSNVEIVQEMTDMIAAQRAYEINARAISAAENMMRSVDDLLR